MFHLDQIGRRFGPQVLFSQLTWKVPASARLGLLGPNGAGKTTLLRILAGLESPDEGAVHRPSRSRVGYLPQEVETVRGGTVLSVAVSGSPELAKIEGRLAELERSLSGLPQRDPRAQKLAAEYGQLRHRFEALEGDRAEARAKRVLSGLGVDESRFHDPIDSLSGGWRMRILLARLLLGTPDLLLLDEPTNHLDLDAIDWLERFLGTYPGTLVAVSHDRYFLNRLVRGVAVLESGRLEEYAGNYDDFVTARRLSEERREKVRRQREREAAKTRRFVERFRYKSSKARQVQSRLRMQAKLEPIGVARRSRELRFGFPPAPRCGHVVARGETFFKRYGETVVYEGAQLLLRRGERMALVGPNGAGKSTLLKLLAGRTAPDSGLLELGHNVKMHYYAQHQLEQLDSEATVLEELERVAPPNYRPRLRGLLGRFLFSGTSVEKKVAVLSGGEKARLALARMLVRPANLLLLDEPTNHLDLAGREVLEAALAEYTGSLVVVSHDRYFINRVATLIVEVGAGRIELHPGDYDDYVRSRLDLREGRASDGNGPPRVAAKDSRREQKRRSAERRNRLYQARKKLEDRLVPVEFEIAELEGVVQRLQEAQADPRVYRDPQEARRVAREKGEAEARLEKLYARWEALAEDVSDA